MLQRNHNYFINRRACDDDDDQIKPSSSHDQDKMEIDTIGSETFEIFFY